MIRKKEIWRDIVGYVGLYKVSNFGRVKSLNYKGTHKEGLLKPCVNPDGYQYVTLYKKGQKNKYPTIHRLVFQAFVRPLKKGEDVHHIKEKDNNRADNLIALTKSQHLAYHKRLKHTKKDPKTGRFIKENKE